MLAVLITCLYCVSVLGACIQIPTGSIQILAMDFKQVTTSLSLSFLICETGS